MGKKTKSMVGEEDRTEAAPQTWEDDQKRREYYYDDAHGYQNYEPDDDDDPDSREKHRVIENDPV